MRLYIRNRTLYLLTEKKFPDGYRIREHKLIAMRSQRIDSKQHKPHNEDIDIRKI